MTQMPHEEEQTITTTTMDDTHREDSQESSYRPAEHFLELYGGGKDKKTKYLPVAHRVHWFNQDLPGSFEIRTEIVYHAPDKPVTVEVERWVGEYPHKRKEIVQVTKPGEVIVKATVIDHAHFKQATAHKYECVANFADALEKAETGAIGRALALLGYGTLDAELDEGRIVDSPTQGDEGKRYQQQRPASSPSSTPAPTSPLARALAIPGVKRGLPPPPPTNGNGGKGGSSITTSKNGGTPVPPAPAPAQQKNGATPPVSAAAPSVSPQASTPSEEEMRGALKDYELSVSSDIFIHFILHVCKQPAKRSEWNIAHIYKELLVWQAGGEEQWLSGKVTAALVEKLRKMSEAFPKASFAAFKTRLPFLQQEEGGKTFSDCTSAEVLSVIETMREVAYLHDLGMAYDLFVDPSRKARIAFHHLKTTYSVDHPLDLFAAAAAAAQTGGGEGDGGKKSLVAYQNFLEEAYTKKPDVLSAELRKHYAARLPVPVRAVAEPVTATSVIGPNS